MKRRVGVLVLAGTLCASAFSMDLHDIVRQGEQLPAAEAAELEKSLIENPDQLDVRIRLIGYYWMQRFKNRAIRPAREKQVLWLIEHQPEHEIHSLPYCHMDAMFNPSGYVKAGKLWRNHADSDEASAQVLANAAGFFLLSEPGFSENYLKRAQELEPDNAQWNKELAQVYHLRQSTASKGEVTALGKMELVQLEAAHEKSGLMEKGYMWGDLAIAACKAGDYEKAATYAHKMVNFSGLGWNSGNNVHKGNMVLGLVALKNGDIEQAKACLIASGKTKGSPQLNSFGPNMTLAKALLESGEVDTVVEYFDLCSNFWEMDRDRLEEWTVLAKAGKIPDFGANLNY
ncbi:hypothetical protein P4E94_10570 [Pontiellaceae bacterium B12219]|nr:hypothetical protein [Pontiellaceae bacterium B12219]